MAEGAADVVLGEDRQHAALVEIVDVDIPALGRHEVGALLPRRVVEEAARERAEGAQEREDGDYPEDPARHAEDLQEVRAPPECDLAP